MRDFLKVYVPIALLIAAGFALAYHFIDPGAAQSPADRSGCPWRWL